MVGVPETMTAGEAAPAGAGARAEEAALLDAVRMFTAVSVRAGEAAGQLSPVQLRALTILSRVKGPNLGELAEAMGVAVSTASRLVDRLIAAGWVDRRASEATRREITLGLTEAGHATLDRYDELRLAQLRAGLDRLPARRRGTVVRALADLAAAVDRP